MSALTESILAQLRAVDAERQRWASSPDLRAKIVALKRFQQRRFWVTYADLLNSPRYAGAARFFLDQLYGPKDFTQRDAQFARVVPTLARMFPAAVVAALAALAALHALSESLDNAMASTLGSAQITGADYVEAWQSVGCASSRSRQLALTLEIAGRLDQIIRKPMLRRSLHFMRGPARAAGVAELQRFLETGFEAFHLMGGANRIHCPRRHTREGVCIGAFCCRSRRRESRYDFSARVARFGTLSRTWAW